MTRTAWFHPKPRAHDGKSAPAPQARHQITAHTHNNLEELDSASWDRLVDGSVEGYDLYRALETVPPPGFSLGALTVEQQGCMLANAPLFRTRFSLLTSFQGDNRSIAQKIQTRLPNATSLRIIGLGSPMSDNCSISISRDLTPSERDSIRAVLLDQLFVTASQEGAQILVVKCLGPEVVEWDDLLRRRGFSRIRSVPTVVLALPYASLDHYCASLPKKTGAYLERKMRAARNLRIEYRTSIAGLESTIQALHDATLAQSSVDYGDFDKLHPEYFKHLLAGLGARAQLMLCWKGSELLSFQVFLVGRNRIIANKIGMKYPDAREHNLYFVNWLKMIEFATEHGIGEIEMGATTYGTKMLLGGRLDTRWIYFRARLPGLTMLTRPLHRFFDFEANDPELQHLGAAAAAGKRPTARPT